MLSIVTMLLNSRRGDLKVLNLGDISSPRPGVEGRDERSQRLFQHVIFIPSSTWSAVVLRA